jgi:predicted DCC family thiol-disulfide oxidoreductase YuxK
MSNPQVYPITAAFEQWWVEVKGLNPLPNEATERVYRIMASNIGEYEHGSVDWDGSIKDYVEVCKDLILTIWSVEGEEL